MLYVEKIHILKIRTQDVEYYNVPKIESFISKTNLRNCYTCIQPRHSYENFISI